MSFSVVSLVFMLTSLKASARAFHNLSLELDLDVSQPHVYFLLDDQLQAHDRSKSLEQGGNAIRLSLLIPLLTS